MILSLSDAEAYFGQFVSRTAHVTGKDVTVTRMWPLLEKAGNPQDNLRVVHLAGTSGKTSTAYYCASLLQQAGARVGLTVSPHVIKITERLQLQGEPVSDEQYCQLLNEFIDVMGSDFDASYFEFMITFVLWSFVRLNVDYAVIETGLGGLHDGTNVFRSSDKVCVITDIGFDHQHILGNTLPEISAQKAGIIQQNNHVFMYEQSDEVMGPINKQITIMNATLHISEFKSTIDMLPTFQKRNWSLAHDVYSYIAMRDKLDLLTQDGLEQSKFNVPGRMQEITHSGTHFVLDGAHNVQKMTALISSFKQKYGVNKVACIVAMKEDKDYKECIPLLRQVAHTVYCCAFLTQQDMPIHSIDPVDLQKACIENGLQAFVSSTVDDAIKRCMYKKEPVVLITGSFYVLSDAFKSLTD